MNGAQYLLVLEECLKLMMSTCNCTIFMHNGAPCHTFCFMKSWLENKGIEVLGPWPGQSPNFNPIKNLTYSQNEGIQEANDAGPIPGNNTMHVVHPNLIFCLQGLGAFCSIESTSL